MLAAHFLHLFAAEMGLKESSLSPEAVVALKNYDFPGNVREFKNIIERALIESGGGRIQSEHLRLPGRQLLASSLINTTARGELASALPLNLAEAEDLLIQRALKETNGNIAEAARLLGIHRTRIYRKMAQQPAA